MKYRIARCCPGSNWSRRWHAPAPLFPECSAKAPSCHLHPESWPKHPMPGNRDDLIPESARQYQRAILQLFQSDGRTGERAARARSAHKPGQFLPGSPRQNAARPIFAHPPFPRCRPQPPQYYSAHIGRDNRTEDLAAKP